MEFVLKDKPYRWYDFLTIPFCCDALSTIALGVQKLLTALAAVFQVAVLAGFIDSANLSLQNSQEWKHTFVWFLLLVICVGWRRISFMVGRIFISRLTVNAAVKMGTAFTDKRSRLHYSQIENEDSWNLINRVCKSPENQVRLMLQRTYNLMLYIIRIFGVLYIVFVNVWWIGIMTALMCIPLIFISLRSGEKNYSTTKQVAEHERRYQYLGEVLSGRAAVNERSLFDFSNKVNEEWFRQYEQARKIKLKANIVLTRSVRGGSAVVTLFSSLIAVALITPTAEGRISIGMFIALATGMYDLVNMVGVELVKAVSQLSQCREYLRELSDFSALEEVEGVDETPESEPFTFRELEFKNVTFRYPGTSKKILKNVSFSIENNGHYAFVGANGTGKTTITKLMTTLYDQYEGQILVNKKELRTYTQKQIKAMFCGVYQDFAKYSISLEENVLVGSVNAINEKDNGGRVEAALKTAGLWDKAAELPLGLKTPLGRVLEGGIDLSGGQWQKLAMARTIVSKAPLLILDEPTAALDPMSESRMYEEFAEISKGKTTIFISHRLGSTKLAKKIFVLEGGTVAETGSHKELMARDGLYAAMYNSQRSWYQ